ncbi:hypothetical protein D3C80_1655250 [compost metagenome]
MGLPQWNRYGSQEYAGDDFDEFRFFIRGADVRIPLCLNDVGTSRIGCGLRLDSQHFQRLGDALVRSCRCTDRLFLCRSAAALRIPWQGLQRVCDLRRFWHYACAGLLLRADR